MDSLYLLTAPVVAAAGLLAVLGGLCVATLGLLLPGGSRLVTGGLAPARWFADLERCRIAKVRPPAHETEGAHERARQPEITASDPGLWLDVAHAVAVLPVALVTSLVTALWWVGVAGATAFPRNPYTPGSLRPETLYAGSAQSHIDLSLGLTSPDARLTVGTVAGVLLLLPLLTRAFVATQAGLGQALLSNMSALGDRFPWPERRGQARYGIVTFVCLDAPRIIDHFNLREALPG